MTDHQHTADVLNRAADLIEERGWVRGNWGTHAAAPLCLEGGILAALGQRFASVDLQDLWECPSYRAVADYLALPYTREPGENLATEEALWAWNDENTRTASEVIETLRAAAAIEQAKHDAEQPATVAVTA